MKFYTHTQLKAAKDTVPHEWIAYLLAIMHTIYSLERFIPAAIGVREINQR